MNNNKTTLRILLVLSIIGSGVSMLSYAMMGICMPYFQKIFDANPGMLPEQMAVVYERLFEVPRLFFGLTALLYALSLLGVALMWKLRPAGFHCYTLAQLLLLLVPVLFLGKGFLGIGDIMFTILFVAAYYFLLRSLGVFNKDNTEAPSDSDVEEKKED